jgi:hypothetical protein
MEESFIKGVNVIKQKNVQDAISGQMMKNSFCMLDSTYQLNNIGANAVYHMDKCSHSGLYSVQMAKTIILHDKSLVRCTNEMVSGNF